MLTNEQKAMRLTAIALIERGLNGIEVHLEAVKKQERELLEERNVLLATLAELGVMSHREIGARYGLTGTTISKLVKKMKQDQNPEYLRAVSYFSQSDQEGE